MYRNLQLNGGKEKATVPSSHLVNSQRRRCGEHKEQRPADDADGPLRDVLGDVGAPQNRDAGGDAVSGDRAGSDRDRILGRAEGNAREEGAVAELCSEHEAEGAHNLGPCSVGRVGEMEGTMEDKKWAKVSMTRFRKRNNCLRRPLLSPQADA